MAFPIKLNGVVLRTVNYREYDRMLTLFTQEQGRVEASARGARRPSNKLLAATTQFTLGEFLLNERGGVLDLEYSIELERSVSATNLCHVEIRPAATAVIE